MSAFNRRNFLRATGIAVLPAFLPAIAAAAEKNEYFAGEPIIKFFYDGEDFTPSIYVDELQKINSKEAIKRDFLALVGVLSWQKHPLPAATYKPKNLL